MLRRVACCLCVFWLAASLRAVELPQTRVVRGTLCCAYIDLAEWLHSPPGNDISCGEIRWVVGKRHLLLDGRTQTARVEGRVVSLAVAPFRGGNVTFVPLRFVAEALGATVRSDARQAVVTTPEGRRFVLYLDGRARQVAAFFTAVERGEVNGIVAKLHADPTLLTVQDARGRSPLHLAAMCSQPESANTLLRAGAAVDAHDLHDTTPLQLAVQQGDVALTKRLLQAGASVNPPGEPPLITAALLKHLVLCDLLLASGADVNAVGKAGHTALHIAAENRQLELINHLLALGANPNAHSTGGEAETPLHEAAAQDHVDVATRLLAAGAEVNAVTRSGETPLHRAVQAGQRRMAAWLLEHGAAVDAMTAGGGTPLRIAVENSNQALGQLLLDHGAQAMQANPRQTTLLHLAAGNGSVELVDLLLAHGAVVNAIDHDGRTPLHHAARLPLSMVTEHLLAHHADPNIATTDNGDTPLHLAAMNRHTAVAAALLAHKANVNAVDFDGQTPLYLAEKGHFAETAAVLRAQGGSAALHYTGVRAPLHWAVQQGDVAAVERLLAAGANVNATDDHRTYLRPLHLAAISGNTRIAAVLLAHGAQINKGEENWGMTPLHYAAERGDVAMVRFLLAHGANPMAGGQEGETPLFCAVTNDHLAAAQELLAHGAKLNDPDFPVLLFAVRKGSQRMVNFLLAHGIDVNLQDKEYGRAPLHEAALDGKLDMVRLLVRAGARVNIADTEGMTPLHHAVLGENPTAALPVISYLLAHGARINARTTEGRTPLGLIRNRASHAAIARLLRRHGGRI